MLSGLSPAERDELHLQPDADAYHYLNQSGCTPARRTLALPCLAFQLPLPPRICPCCKIRRPLQNRDLPATSHHTSDAVHVSQRVRRRAAEGQRCSLHGTVRLCTAGAQIESEPDAPHFAKLRQVVRAACGTVHSHLAGRMCAACCTVQLFGWALRTIDQCAVSHAHMHTHTHT